MAQIYVLQHDVAGMLAAAQAASPKVVKVILRNAFDVVVETNADLLPAERGAVARALRESQPRLTQERVHPEDPDPGVPPPVPPPRRYPIESLNGADWAIQVTNLGVLTTVPLP